MWSRSLVSVTAIALAATIVLFAATARAEGPTAEAIYAKTGVEGGLVIHLGCGDGTLTAALRADDRYLVRGLDADPANVAKAREALRAKGLYGPVSVDLLEGPKLPFVDGLVRLVVASSLGDVSLDEVLRVLAPEGVAYVRRDDGWQKTVKPRPEGIDEWTHFLHDAGGNAVAEDSQIGPPKSLRWVAGPRWCRSHEMPSSVNALVTAGSRIFMIFDDAPTGVYKDLPWQCHLTARDAFSGVLLWKAPMRRWQPEFGTGTGNRWNIHHTIPRRLVALADRVYVALGFLESPVSVLDAATGEILIEALEGTRGTDEMVLCDGVLIVKITEKRSVPASPKFSKAALSDSLAAVDVDSGKLLWREEGIGVVPYALSAQDGRVVYHNMDELVCLDTRSGEEAWRAANPIASMVGGGATLVVHDGVVLFHARAQFGDAGGNKKGGGGARLFALSLQDGELLWQGPGAGSLAAACTQPTDLFVAGGLVWCGNSLKGRDLHTGEVKKTLSIGKLISPGHHYRCHRGKATERFLIWPKRGAESIDTEEQAHMRNDWPRAPCFTGPTPANGLFYAPPSQCFCYPGVKVNGFLAMSDEARNELKPSTAAQLEKGPAYLPSPAGGRGPEVEGRHTDPQPSDWPRYRRNGQMSGSTPVKVAADLAPQWEVDLESNAPQAVVVGDRLWVVEKDTHRVRCLDAKTGRDVWSFAAAGRIDSAPTVDAGRLLFGCRDGSVYCLRAADGELAWRFRAAPKDRQLVAYGAIESVWPVHGSVLVENGVVYFAAGRSSFLDGGIIVYGLDAKTGRPLYHHVLEGPWPDVENDTGTPFAMEGALPDLIVSDGNNNLYMGRIKFDAELNRLDTKQESSLGELDMGANHLVATGGFLDDTGFDRLYWMYSKRWPGFYFAQQSPKAGQLVVFDGTTTYAVKYFYRRIQWSPAFFPAEHGYLLFADDNDNEPILTGKGESAKPIEWLPKESYNDRFRRGGRGVEKGTGYQRARPAKWQTMVPLRIRAMMLAGDLLFAAGTPDVLDPDDPLGAFQGRAGARLQVFSAKDGSTVKSYELSSLPVFDGLSAAQGRLYLATQDAKLLCFGPTAAE